MRVRSIDICNNVCLCVCIYAQVDNEGVGQGAAYRYIQQCTYMHIYVYTCTIKRLVKVRPIYIYTACVGIYKYIYAYVHNERIGKG